MKTIYVGGYGAGNFGDDLILSSILDSDPEATVVGYGRPLLEREISYITFESFFRNADALLGEFDALVFGGGGAFWSQEHILEMLAIALLAKNHGLRVEFRRIGLHGFNQARDASRHLLRIADAVTFREHDSLDLAKQHLECTKAIVEPDYACLQIRPSPRITSERTRIAINIGSTRFIDDPSFSTHVQSIYAEVARRFADVAELYYLPFCSHVSSHNQNDLAKADLLFAKSSGAIKCKVNALTANQLIGECTATDIFVGERFHMHIIAHALGRPYIPFIHNEQTKYRALAYEYKDSPVFYELSQPLLIDMLTDRLRFCIQTIQSAPHSRVVTHIDQVVPAAPTVRSAHEALDGVVGEPLQPAQRAFQDSNGNQEPEHALP
jgi:polysaccharide pyruvyl transferase WcaK-like protein